LARGDTERVLRGGHPDANVIAGNNRRDDRLRTAVMSCRKGQSRRNDRSTGMATRSAMPIINVEGGSVPIPMKPPLCSEMIAPRDSGMISPPV